MPLETASYISQLDAANPPSSDPKSQGDNHLRMIKSVLQTQFPSLGTVPVNATAAQLNALAAGAGLLSVGTSTTSLTIASGAQSFTTQSGRGFGAGQTIKITSNASAANFMIGTCTAYDSTTGAMSVLVTAVVGSGTYADWSVVVFVDSTPSITRSARTSNTALGTADKGTLIDITSGTFTQTFDAAATLGDGWWCYLRNSGTGVVTLDPDAAETIEGVATKALDPGQTVIVQCDGVALRTVALAGVGNHAVVVHTGNGLGSTATRIRRFTTAMTNVGSAITYADSAANGASFTVNEQGVYSIFYSDQASTPTDLPIGVSLNSAELTTNVNTIAVSSRLALCNLTGAPSCVSVSARLGAGDVIRPHTTGAATGTTNATFFAIRKVGI